MALACTLTCLTLYSHAWPFDAAVVRLGYNPVGSAKRVDSISGPETFSREIEHGNMGLAGPGGRGESSICLSLSSQVTTVRTHSARTLPHTRMDHFGSSSSKPISGPVKPIPPISMTETSTSPHSVSPATLPGPSPKPKIITGRPANACSRCKSRKIKVSSLACVSRRTCQLTLAVQL